MDFKRIQYFMAVAEEENFHKASEHLHIAQPALSRQIRILEEELGFELFTRLPRGVKLSAAGRSYLEDARKLVQFAGQAQQRAIRIDNGNVGSLRVGFNDAAHPRQIFRSIFSTMKMAYPEITFNFILAPSDKQIEMLYSGQVDIGFILKWKHCLESIDTIDLCDDEIVLAISKTHPKANRDVLLPEDIRDEEFVWPDRIIFRDYSDTLLKACANVGFIPKAANDGLSSIGAQMSLIAAGMGVAFVPRSYEPHLADNLVLRRVEGIELSAKLQLAWNTERPSSVLDNFLRIVREQLSRRPQLSDG